MKQKQQVYMENILLGHANLIVIQLADKSPEILLDMETVIFWQCSTLQTRKMSLYLVPLPASALIIVYLAVITLYKYAWLRCSRLALF